MRTYKVLAWHDHYDAILETIRAENPDILLLQELNKCLVWVLQNDLRDDYPYQVLEPVDNPEGICAISKFPIRQSEVILPQLWAGGPQILELEWNGEEIMLENFHMTPTTGIFPLDEVEESIRSREEEARLLAGQASQTESVIMGGDAITSSLSDVFQIITTEVSDSFRAAGFGLRHTFPGSTIPESDPPHLGRLLMPSWMMRIDYIFHSDDWATLSARTARMTVYLTTRG